jgi:hypothetical protein
MAKDSVSDWDTTAANNTDVGGITLAEGAMLPSGVNNAFRELMAQIKSAFGSFLSAWTAASSSGPASLDFHEDTDNGTNRIRITAPSSVASDRTLTLPDATGTPALLELADQTITGGARVTSLGLNSGSVVSSGTVTLDPGDRPMQHYTNGGAHTLAPGSNTGYILLDITNNGSAGAITTSGWTKVVGAFTTTNGHKFRCGCSIGNGGSLLTIQALQ